MNTLVKAEIWTVARTEQGNAVLVRPVGSELAVPIFIGQLETQSILIGFGGVPMPRPLTHDLVLNLLRRFDAELLRVEVNELHDGTFYARLVLGRDGSEHVVDARPSDALALAVRKKCPVYIAESVVEAAGISVELLMDSEKAQAAGGMEDLNPQLTGEPPAEADFAGSLGETLGHALEGSKEALQDELRRAVDSEEYEHAAALRDILKSLES